MEPRQATVLFSVTPSSSSMISFPMEAKVVHLQLLVALTAQRLWALNLQTGGGEKKVMQGQRVVEGDQEGSGTRSRVLPPLPFTPFLSRAALSLPLTSQHSRELLGFSLPVATQKKTRLTFTGEAMGGDGRESLPADVAEGGAGVRAGVPVVHPREVLHVELGGLGYAKRDGG